MKYQIVKEYSKKHESSLADNDLGLYEVGV